MYRSCWIITLHCVWARKIRLRQPRTALSRTHASGPVRTCPHSSSGARCWRLRTCTRATFFYFCFWFCFWFCFLLSLLFCFLYLLFIIHLLLRRCFFVWSLFVISFVFIFICCLLPCAMMAKMMIWYSKSVNPLNLRVDFHIISYPWSAISCLLFLFIIISIDPYRNSHLNHLLFYFTSLVFLFGISAWRRMWMRYWRSGVPRCSSPPAWATRSLRRSTRYASN